MNTVKEWSDAFDVLYNQVMSNSSAALDEYDKSIFLTKAQEEIVKNYFNPKGNKYQEGYDDTAKRQADFATLVKTATLTTPSGYSKFDTRSDAYVFPPDYFIAINEQFQVVTNGKTYPYTIIPISYTTYKIRFFHFSCLPVDTCSWMIKTVFTEWNWFAPEIKDFISVL